MLKESVALAMTLCFALSALAGGKNTRSVKVDHASICASQLEPLEPLSRMPAWLRTMACRHASGGTHWRRSDSTTARTSSSSPP